MLFLISLLFSIYLLANLFREYKSRSLTSPIALYSALFLFHFSVPGLALSLDILSFKHIDNVEFALQAQILVILSFIFFKLGSKAITIFKNKYKHNTLPITWKKNRVIIVIILLLAFGYLTRMFFIYKGMYFQEMRTSIGYLDSIHSSLRQAERLPLLCIYITALYYYSNFNSDKILPNIVSSLHINKQWLYLLILLLIVEIIYWLPSGRKTDIFFAILTPLIIRYFYKPKLPSLKVMLLIFIFVITFFQASNIYRYYMNVGNYAETPFVEAVINSFKDAKSDKLSFKESPTNKNYMMNRLNLLEPVSASIRITDNHSWKVSYGAEYIKLLENMIPRIFWEDKPGYHYGNMFGYYSGYLSEGDLKTSISVTFIGEAYNNFKWLAPIVMFLFGMFFTYIYIKAIKNKSVNWVFLYILTFPVLLYPGGTFVLYFGGLVKSWLAAGILIIFLSSKKYPQNFSVSNLGR
jgi:oligosaccharide repeat unit polymerase